MMTEPRGYEQRVRADTAARTRQRILDAVHSKLRASPCTPLSVGEIAIAAQVTRPTIYAIFGSRAGLFTAAGEDVLVRAGFEEVLEGAACSNALEGLRSGFEGMVRVYANGRDIFRTLYSMAHLDAASFGGAIEHLERGRAACMADLAARLQSQNYLDAGTDIDSATDTLWLLTSFESFDLLCTGRRRDTASITRTLLSAAAPILRNARGRIPQDGLTDVYV